MVSRGCKSNMEAKEPTIYLVATISSISFSDFSISDQMFLKVLKIFKCRIAIKLASKKPR
jgi:hypothetical protein